MMAFKLYALCPSNLCIISSQRNYYFKIKISFIYKCINAYLCEVKMETYSFFVFIFLNSSM